EVQEREGAKFYLEGRLNSLGNLYASQNEWAKAIPYYERAFSLAKEIGALSDASKWAGNLAHSFSELKNWDRAEQFNEESRKLKERNKDAESLIYTRLYAANIAQGRGQSATAEHLYQTVIEEAAKNPSILWDAHAGLAELYREIGEKKKAYDQFEAAIRTI